MPEYIMISTVELPALQPVIRCGICRYWSPGIAYSSIGVCGHTDHLNQITRGSFFCADGEPIK